MSAQHRIMKDKKPLAPWLPGRSGRMTREQFDTESDQYDAEFSATGAKRFGNVKRHPRKQGPSPKRIPRSIRAS
jgi:hypothetical protein